MGCSLPAIICWLVGSDRYSLAAVHWADVEVFFPFLLQKECKSSRGGCMGWPGRVTAAQCCCHCC